MRTHHTPEVQAPTIDEPSEQTTLIGQVAVDNSDHIILGYN